MQRTGAGTSPLRKGVLLVPFLCLAACALQRPDIIQVGPWFPAKDAKDVAVFSTREETARPWGAIAVIHGDRVPAGNRSAIEKQKVQARELAAKAGADGVIISEESGNTEAFAQPSQPQEVFISALAFKYAAEISTAAR